MRGKERERFTYTVNENLVEVVLEGITALAMERGESPEVILEDLIRELRQAVPRLHKDPILRLCTA